MTGYNRRTGNNRVTGTGPDRSLYRGIVWSFAVVHPYNCYMTILIKGRYSTSNIAPALASVICARHIRHPLL